MYIYWFWTYEHWTLLKGKGYIAKTNTLETRRQYNFKEAKKKLCLCIEFTVSLFAKIIHIWKLCIFIFMYNLRKWRNFMAFMHPHKAQILSKWLLICVRLWKCLFLKSVSQHIDEICQAWLIPFFVEIVIYCSCHHYSLVFSIHPTLKSSYQKWRKSWQKVVNMIDVFVLS